MSSVVSFKQQDNKFNVKSGIDCFESLGVDVIQYILTFTNNSKTNIKSVSKTMNKLATDIEPKLLPILKQRLESVKKEQLCANAKIKFDKEKNRIWIIHQDAINVDSTDATLINTNNLKDLLCNNQCKKGDKIFVYDGEYVFDNAKVKIKCNLQFIGMSDKVYFVGNINYIPSHCNVYFENIHFLYSENPKHPASYRLLMEPYSNLWLKDCLINFDFIGIQVDECCTLNMKNCKFVGKGRAVNLYSIADSVNIIGCIFTECDQYCINIRNDVTHFKDKWMDNYSGYDDDDETESDESDDFCVVSKTFVELRCIGNIFQCKNGCVGVAWLSEDVSMELHSETAQQIKYEFSNNLLKYESNSGWKYKSITKQNVNHYASW